MGSSNIKSCSVIAPCIPIVMVIYVFHSRTLADLRADRSERRHRALSVNSVFLLRALAAWKMLRQQKIRCYHAAGKPAIGAECSEDQRSN